MITATVWLLLSVMGSGGHVTVVERFPTVEQCQHVAKNLPEGYYKTRCVQATIVVRKD